MISDIKKLAPDEFPTRLREIADPPAELYLAGTLPPETYTYLCVVGSRKHTSYGAQVVERLIAGLSGYPIAIISGLAIGIDTLAHRAALAAHLPTIAIPGSGLDTQVLYPKTSHILAEKILESGGALLSPFKPDFKATEWSFPARNRIMAGISQAVLLIEAEEKSGTLITARLALDYNRDVYAVPGSIFSSASKGTNALIAEGATPITGSTELLHVLGFNTEKKVETSEQELIDATPEEQKIWESLFEPRTRDEILRTLALPTQQVNEILSLMELRGLIKESGGKLCRAS